MNRGILRTKKVVPTGGGGGVTALIELTDVDASGQGIGRGPVFDGVKYDLVDVAVQAELDSEIAARTTADGLRILLTEKGAANGVAELDVNGKLPSARLPPLALSEFLGSVSSQAAMLALSGQRGDWCVRTDPDPDETYMLTADDATQLSNWQKLGAFGGVISVNGATGVVVIPADPAAGTPGLRTLGTSATQALPGNHASTTDQRVPTDGSVTDAKVSGSAAIAETKLSLASDAAAGTASRRTLGTGATQAAAGNHIHTVTPTTVSSMGTAQTINLGSQDYMVYDGTLTSASCALTFTGFPVGKYAEILVRLHQDATGGRLITFTDSILWPDGNAPVLVSGATKITEFLLSSLDGGTTIEGVHSQPVRNYEFSYDGALTSFVGKHRLYFEVDARIVKVRATVGDAPVTNPAIFDIQKNGTANNLYTTQANRPSVPAGSNTIVATLPDVKTLAANDYITIDCDQAASAGYLTLKVRTIETA